MEGALCEALAYANAHQVFHRDVEPEKVVLLEGGRPVRTDFGLAKDRRAGLDPTVEEQRIGTPLGRAPELLLGP